MINRTEGYGDPEVAAAMAEVASVTWRAADPELVGVEGPEETWGAYHGLPPRIQLEDDGRTATLLSPLSYVGPDGSEWPVPTGARLDGASIPRPLWTLIGGPFEGRYRNASIVHDRYCDHHLRTWRDTHRMFHDAMRCSGVGSAQARIMFYGVYRFGPRWPDPGSEGPAAEWRPPLDLAALIEDARAIAEHGLTPEEIEALAEARDQDIEADASFEGAELPSKQDGTRAWLW